MIIEWFKKRKEIKEKEYNDFLLKIKKYSLDYSPNKFTNTFSFEKEIGRIFSFSNKKDYWHISGMEDVVLNRLVRNLILNMSKDSNLRNEIYNNILKNKEGKETSIFCMLLESSHRLNKKTRDYLLHAFPLEQCFKLYLRNIKENIYVSPLRNLLKSPLNDFFINVCEHYGINEIYNTSNIWAKDNVNISHFFDEVMELKINIEKNPKINKKQNDKFNYIINTVTIESLSLNDNKSKKDKDVFLGLLAKSDVESMKILSDKNMVNTEELYSVIPSLLCKYELENDKNEQHKIITLLKEIFSHLNINIADVNKFKYISYPQDIGKKTYDMWIQEFLDPNNLNYDDIYPILLGIFLNDKLGPNMKLFDFYMNSVTKENADVRDGLISNFYSSLCNTNIKENLINHFETYLDYFYYNCNYNINMSLENNNKQILNMPTYALLNGVEFNIEHLKLLKNYDFEPFKKFNDSFSFYEMANEEVKSHIANTYMKEKAEFEKEKINSIIKSSSEPEERENNIINKKRL